MKLSRMTALGAHALLAALAAGCGAVEPQKPTPFEALVPEKSGEMSAQAEQSPRTLFVIVTREGKVTLTRGGVPVAEATTGDPAPVAARLAQEFKERGERGVWKEGYEGRTDLPPEERIEKTVFVKAPQNFKYGDVARVIDAIREAGASPVGIQTEAIEQ